MLMIHKVALQMLLDEEYYKADDTLSIKVKGILYTIERTDTGWKLIEHGNKGVYTEDYKSLAELFKKGIFDARMISY